MATLSLPPPEEFVPTSQMFSGDLLVERAISNMMAAPDYDTNPEAQARVASMQASLGRGMLSRPTLAFGDSSLTPPSGDSSFTGWGNGGSMNATPSGGNQAPRVPIDFAALAAAHQEKINAPDYVPPAPYVAPPPKPYEEDAFDAKFKADTAAILRNQAAAFGLNYDQLMAPYNIALLDPSQFNTAFNESFQNAMSAKRGMPARPLTMTPAALSQFNSLTREEQTQFTKAARTAEMAANNDWHLAAAKEARYLPGQQDGHGHIVGPGESIWGPDSDLVSSTAKKVGEQLGLTRMQVIDAAIAARDTHNQTYSQGYEPGSSPAHLIQGVAEEMFKTAGVESQQLFTPEQLAQSAQYASNQAEIAAAKSKKGGWQQFAMNVLALVSLGYSLVGIAAALGTTTAAVSAAASTGGAGMLSAASTGIGAADLAAEASLFGSGFGGAVAAGGGIGGAASLAGLAGGAGMLPTATASTGISAADLAAEANLFGSGFTGAVATGGGVESAASLAAIVNAAADPIEALINLQDVGLSGEAAIEAITATNPAWTQTAAQFAINNPGATVDPTLDTDFNDPFGDQPFDTDFNDPFGDQPFDTDFNDPFGDQPFDDVQPDRLDPDFNDPFGDQPFDDVQPDLGEQFTEATGLTPKEGFKLAKDVYNVVQKVYGLTQGGPEGRFSPNEVPADAPPEPEGGFDPENPDPEYIAALVDYVGLDLDVMAEQGLTPGTPEYYQYIMNQMDMIIAEIFGADPSALLEGEDIEGLQAMLRGKTDDELAQLMRALYVRGQVGQLTFSNEAFDPFSGETQDIGDNEEGVSGPLAAWMRGLAGRGNNLANARGSDARGMLGSEFGKGRKDLYSMQGKKDARRLQELLAVDEDEEEKRKRGFGIDTLGLGEGNEQQGMLLKALIEGRNPRALERMLASLGDSGRQGAAIEQLLGRKNLR